ncbi:MAG: hypothetical protein H7333_07915 [Bdellovibrionales bacterium]|nr:hypothetical protein [Oligoflexia bacterium]
MIQFLGLLLAATAGLLSNVQAQTLIEDPNHLLNQVDQFVNGSSLSFQKALTCGDIATFDHPVDKCEIGCSEDGCWTSCQSSEKVVSHKVSQCSETQVSIFSDDAENVDYTRDEYAQLQGNLLRKFMANLSTYISASGKLALKQVQNSTFVLDPKVPGSPAYSAMQVTGQFIPEGSARGMDVLFTVLKDVPGVAQIARFRINNETWFRLKSIQKAKQ